MRQIHAPQRQLGETAIEAIEFDLQSRDDIPQALQGLQHIYLTPKLRETIFSHPDRLIPEGVDTGHGRPGMDLWNAFVLATLRLKLNADYDRIVELANEHNTLRRMLEYGLLDGDKHYCLQTIKDNVRLFTHEILEDINQAVVNAGLQVLGWEEEMLKGRCDSFVVETDVAYPTDIN